MQIVGIFYYAFDKAINGDTIIVEAFHLRSAKVTLSKVFPTHISCFILAVRPFVDSSKAKCSENVQIVLSSPY